MRRTAAAALALALLTGCAATRTEGDDQSELARTLGDRVAGKPVNCISLPQVSGPTVIGRTILYREGGRYWRTQPIGRCPALRPMTTLITEVYGGQLCRNDRFRVLEPGLSIPSASCRFSEFTPYQRPRAAN